MAKLTNIDVYGGKGRGPNPAISEVMLSTEMRQALESVAHMGVLLYQAQVAKRTGQLARSARAYTEIGGKRHDMWVGVIDVSSDHVLPHEFGADVPLFGDVNDRNEQMGTHDLNVVLAMLGGYS